MATKVYNPSCLPSILTNWWRQITMILKAYNNDTPTTLRAFTSEEHTLPCLSRSKRFDLLQLSHSHSYTCLIFSRFFLFSTWAWVIFSSLLFTIFFPFSFTSNLHKNHLFIAKSFPLCLLLGIMRFYFIMSLANGHIISTNFSTTEDLANWV